MVQFLSIIFFFLGFLKFLLGFSKVPISCVILYFVFAINNISTFLYEALTVWQQRRASNVPIVDSWKRVRSQYSIATKGVQEVRPLLQCLLLYYSVGFFFFVVHILYMVYHVPIHPAQIFSYCLLYWIVMMEAASHSETLEITNETKRSVTQKTQGNFYACWNLYFMA